MHFAEYTKTMSYFRLASFVLPFLISVSAHAIQSNGTHNTTAPTSAQIPNWNSGWGASNVTGWNYVGEVGGFASGVYLGNGWVMTAGHVGASTNVVIDGVSLNGLPGTAHYLSLNGNTPDVTIFKTSTSLDLPPLTLAATPPYLASDSRPGSGVAMLGEGGGAGETWGYDHVDYNSYLTQTVGTPYTSETFITASGTSGFGPSYADNEAQIVSGDSGGGDFIYNSATQQWELAGINVGVGTDSNGTVYSFMLEVSDYRSQIAAITAVPEPQTWAEMVLGAGLLFLGRNLVRARFGRRAV